MATNRISDWIVEARFRLARVSDGPGLEAQVLLAHTLNRSRTWVVAHPEFYISQKSLSQLKSSLDRRLRNEPLPYIIGHWEFFGLDFLVDPAVLIPRPETELLVEEAIKWLKQNPSSHPVLEIGTGSGCIAISLAKTLPDIQLVATDFDDQALKVARENAQRHQVVKRIEIIHSDLFENVNGPFRLIYANLPYIPTQKLNKLDVSRFEPWHALDGGVDGLDLIRQVIKATPDNLVKPGLLLLEIEAGQKDAVMHSAFQRFPSAQIQIIEDAAGYPRLLRVENI